MKLLNFVALSAVSTAVLIAQCSNGQPLAKTSLALPAPTTRTVTNTKTVEISQNPPQDFTARSNSMAPFDPSSTSGVQMLNNAVNKIAGSFLNIWYFLSQTWDPSTVTHSRVDQMENIIPVDEWLESPEVREAADLTYGMYLGKRNCFKKCACIFGDYLSEFSLPMKFINNLAFERLFPEDWTDIRSVFSESSWNGDFNCGRFSCEIRTAQDFSNKSDSDNLIYSPKSSPVYHGHGKDSPSSKIPSFVMSLLRTYNNLNN